MGGGMYRASVMTSPVEVGKEEDLVSLKEKAQMLAGQMDEINRQIKKLENENS